MLTGFRTMGVALGADISDLQSGLRLASREVDQWAARSQGAFDRVDRGLGQAQREAASLGRSMSGAFKSAEESARTFERELARVEAQERELFQMQAQAEREMTADFEARARRREEAMGRIGTAAIAVGAALTLGVGLGVDRFADFDSQLSAVQAATRETEANMVRLGEAALQAGADTVFSATEAAAAEENLAKAGVETADILTGALSGSLDLAAAGSLDVATAAEIAATAMTQFRLAGKDVPHIADLLAAGAGKAQGEVLDLALALEYVGVPAAELNVSIEEVVGTLALFAKNGTIGERAGTSLRSMIASLTAPSAKAADTMANLGISVFDAQGSFVGLDGVAGQLNDKLADQSDAARSSALGIIFGNEALQAANILTREGAEGVREWTREVNDQGYAADVAAIKMDNLRGDVEALSGSLETSLVRSGTSANGVLRELVQTGTGVLNLYSDLPGPVQAAGTGLTVLAAGATLASGAFILGAPKVTQFKASIADMGPRAASFSRGLLNVGSVLAGPWGLALAAGVVALGYFAQKKAEATARTQEFARAILLDAGAIGDHTRALIRDRLEQEGALEAAETLGLSYGTLTEALSGSEAAQKAVNDAIMAYAPIAEQQLRGTESQQRAALVLAGVFESLPSQIDAGSESARRQQKELEATATTSDEVAAATGRMTTGLAAIPEVLSDAEKAANEWREELAKLAGGFVAPLDAYSDMLRAKEDAERESAEATAEATKSSKDSWEDYVHDVSVSVDDYLDELGRQVRAQRDWRTNMLLLSTRVSESTLRELERLGPEAAPLIADLVDATDEEFRRLERLLGKSTYEAAGAVADQLIAAAPLLRQVAEEAGQKTADGYARKLAAGKTTVAEIAAEYGIALEDGIPAEVETKVSVSGQAHARRVLRELGAEIERLGQVEIRIGVGRFSGKKLPLAHGGRVWGPGTATSDSIDARLSRGEYVTRAAAVEHYGPGLFEALNRMALPRTVFAGIPGYAHGGLVGQPSPPRVNVTVNAPASATRNGPLIGQIVANYPAPARVGDTVQMELAAVAHTYGLDLEG